MLMPPDAEFFGKYGFTNPILIIFGISQLFGGILLIIQKTRIIGAIIVTVTFLISLFLLFMDKNIPFTILTLVALCLLGLIVKQSLVNSK